MGYLFNTDIVSALGKIKGELTGLSAAYFVCQF